MKMKVRARIDDLRDDEAGETLNDLIIKHIPYNWDDDVFEFTVEVKDIEDISEKIGVDEEGCRAFRGVEITEEEE